MCGIAGQIDWLGSPSRSTVGKITDRLLHRGPDARGLTVLGKACFGHTRLAILDLSPLGAQPMLDRSGELLLSFNGEIFNHGILRGELEKLGSCFRSSSDTEVILEAYRHWGSHCFSRLNGMFSIALWDNKREKLLLVRDRLGKKPLYYFSNENSLTFASEHSALLAEPKIPREINDRAIIQFLSLGYLTTSECMNPHIHRVPPGCVLEWERGGKIQVARYWELSQYFLQKSDYADIKEAEERLRSLLADAVNIRLMSDVPLGAFLSGGIDSSTIVGNMCSFRKPSEVQTFSLGFPERSFSELEGAAEVARWFGVDHTQDQISPHELSSLEAIAACAGEPFADTSIIPMYYLSALARKNVTVVLSGDGADEIFAGYETYVADKLRALLQPIPSPLIRLIEILYRRLKSRDFGKVSTDYKVLQFLKGCTLDFVGAHFSWRELFSHSDIEEMVSPRLKPLVSEAHPLKEFRRFDEEVAGAHPVDRASYIDIKTWLVDDILVKVDRASMAHSLEARAPFLDYRLVEFAASLPVDYKLKGFSKKHILKTSQRALLPKSVIRQKKRGFNAPISRWLFGPLRTVCEQIALDSPVLEYIDRRAVRTALQEHLQYKADNSFKLFALIQLHLYLKHYQEQALGKAA